MPTISLVQRICLCVVLALGPSAQAAEVNVYSARKEALIRPLLERFSAQHGVRLNLVTGDADTLILRLQNEGRNSPADLLLTTDAARLHRARDAGLLQPVQLAARQNATTVRWHDPEGYWFALSLRHRVIVYAPERVSASELSDYLQLDQRRWRGRICVRSSANVYNQSLVAGLIFHHGQERVTRWAQGLVANLARAPTGGDRDQIRAVVAGQCDIALVNDYYLAGMLTAATPSERELAAAVRLYWPAQSGHGAHVNISGAGVTRHAKNRATAVRLLEFMLSPAAQRWYADHNHEYPVSPGLEPGPVLQRWGDGFRTDIEALPMLGKLNRDAVMLMDRAGWK